jgi:hypothetical protein
MEDHDKEYSESPDDLAVATTAPLRKKNKPLIDHLPDAVEQDELGMPVLLAKPGDKLVIERTASMLIGRPWLDTKTYTIESIDTASGNVNLWDDDLGRFAATNYIEGLKVGYRFKLPAGRTGIGRRQRGRPRKNPTGAPEANKKIELGPDGLPIKKRRGRPAGSKNRPKELIRAEKKAKLELKMKKKRKQK